MEQALRTHREQALRLLQENRAQARESVELLVRERLSKLTSSVNGGRALSNEQLQNLYAEVLDLSYTMFSLGYTMAHTSARA